MSKECRNLDCVNYRNSQCDDNFCKICGTLLALTQSPPVEFDQNVLVHPNSLLTPRELRIIRTFCAHQEDPEPEPEPEPEQEPEQEPEPEPDQPSPQNPQNPQKKTRSRRVCISCHKRRKCVQSALKNFCEFCLGKDMYCFGPVKTPQLWNTPYLWTSELLMVSPVLDSGIPKRKEYSFRVVFDTTVSTASTPFNELLVYELRLQDFQLYQFHNYGFAEDVLNKLFASTEKRLIEKNRNWDEPDFPDYASFKADCERFVVCLLLFSSPQLCILAFDAESETAAPFIMLEIMRQFSFQICRDFHDIFDKLDIVLAEHRCDKEHGRRMALLAYHTGLLHGAIVSYDEQIRANPNLNLKMPRFDSATQTILQHLAFLGRGFDYGRMASSRCIEAGSELAFSMVLPQMLFELLPSDGEVDLSNQIRATFPDIYEHFSTLR